jgi:hypothetical protein
MKALEQLMTTEEAGKKPASATRPSSPGRKTGTK